jgi:hypothetical protein
MAPTVNCGTPAICKPGPVIERDDVIPRALQ